MKNVFHYLWRILTGREKILVQDVRLNNPGEEWIDKEEYKNWVQNTNEKYEEERQVRKNRKLEFVWCIVGNVGGKRSSDTGEEKGGTKLFTYGTKVYCFPPGWGDGYQKILVLGQARKSKRIIKVVVNSNLITNWRVKKIYSDRIKSEMIRHNGWDDTDASKKRAEELVSSILSN